MSPAKPEQLIRVCSYEDRPEAMDGLVLMAESLCQADQGISLHLAVPEAPAFVREWAVRRPQVMLTTERPQGVTGWDVKPWFLLRELDAGWPEALWLDTDMIVTGSISRRLREFPADRLIVAEEWNRTKVAVSQRWGLTPARPMWLINACVVRATRLHRRLLERWLQLLQEPRYREAQSIPFASRPAHLLHDGWVLSALLESTEFRDVPIGCLRAGRDIAQCAGSSGYSPHHRFLALFRGLPELIHGLGRKPWEPAPKGDAIRRYLFDLATDVSPYVLAARPVARRLDIHPPWVEAHTRVGAMLRRLTGGHPGMAGMPLAIPHEFFKIFKR